MNDVRVYRDDGPLARLIGATLGRGVPLWPALLIVVGLLPALVVVIVDGDDVSHGLAAACLAWLIVVGGASGGGSHDDRLRWAVPSLLRAAEYGCVLWLGAIAGRSSLPAAFALLGVVAFRHYDLVYRLRYRGAVPPAWVGLASLGWEGRLILVWVLLVAGALPAGMFALAGVLAVALVGESIASWTSSLRVDTHGAYEDEEDEAA
jgi:Family of unknown function (DUF5941)